MVEWRCGIHSSGGNSAKQQIPAHPGFQVPFAAQVKAAVGDVCKVGAVGLITDPQQAETIVASGQADAVLLARQLLREPGWPLRAARELGVDVGWAPQYLRSKL
jgi:2,4-dienoyl-CoA reductase-like NADH-dependent reductase (Old Yellow Enzyme family)